MRIRTRLYTWPDGKTWVFQGTIAEDATAGTHVCTLTVTPGAGNEMMVQGGEVLVGATATAQIVDVFIDDGTNPLERPIHSWSDTSSSRAVHFPTSSTAAASGNATESGSARWLVSGTMRLQLRVQTAAVSVTQTFAVACRIYGAVPTATLADTVGTPTLTTNTSAVF